MKKKKSNKNRAYICVICKKVKKSSKKVKCCSKAMVSKDKGSWNL